MTLGCCRHDQKASGGTAGMSGKLSASVENAAEDVISRRDHPEADDSAEERQGRNLNPPVSVVRRKRDCG